MQVYPGWVLDFQFHPIKIFVLIFWISAQVLMDAGTVAGLKQMYFSMYSPDVERGAILPQQVPRRHLGLCCSACEPAAVH